MTATNAAWTSATPMGRGERSKYPSTASASARSATKRRTLCAPLFQGQRLIASGTPVGTEIGQIRSQAEIAPSQSGDYQHVERPVLPSSHETAVGAGTQEFTLNGTQPPHGNQRAIGCHVPARKQRTTNPGGEIVACA